MGIMMVPQFCFESTPLLQQHFLFFIIKSKRNHTHPLLDSCQKQLTAIPSGTKQALWDGFLPWHGRKWIRSIDGFGQGEAGVTTGIPNKLKNDIIPSELKHFTTKPGQGLKIAKTHHTSKDNPLAIRAILESQRTWRNWQWLPWRNWQSRHGL